MEDPKSALGVVLVPRCRNGLAVQPAGVLSIDKGMQPNNAGHSVDYLEIYEPDVVADEMQLLLRYGASLFAR
jgi:hypothetical protein